MDACRQSKVEIVIRRALIPNPSLLVAISNAGNRLSRFARGSPIPITTIWLNRSSAGNKRCSTRICSMISPVVRLRSTPSSPLAQKTHPIAQPTWLLMQIVRRTPSRNSTHSTAFPSLSLNSSFSVPSFAFWCVAVVVVQISNSAAALSRNDCGRSLMSAKVAARL
jgi:hypothetical protein